MNLSDFRHYQLGEYVYSEHKVKLAVKELKRLTSPNSDWNTGKSNKRIHDIIDEIFGDKLI